LQGKSKHLPSKQHFGTPPRLPSGTTSSLIIGWIKELSNLGPRRKN